jgi:hypothetical protein
MIDLNDEDKGLMTKRSHEIRSAAFTALTAARHAAVMGQIAAHIGELYSDKQIQADVRTAANNVFQAASQASRAFLALSRDDIQGAKGAADDAQAAVHQVLTATQHAFLLASIEVEENISTDVPETEGLVALWEELRNFKPDPFAAPPTSDDHQSP